MTPRSAFRVVVYRLVTLPTALAFIVFWLLGLIIAELAKLSGRAVDWSIDWAGASLTSVFGPFQVWAYLDSPYEEPVKERGAPFDEDLSHGR